MSLILGNVLSITLPVWYTHIRSRRIIVFLPMHLQIRCYLRQDNR